jgi:hypothetical protein
MALMESQSLIGSSISGSKRRQSFPARILSLKGSLLPLLCLLDFKTPVSML